MSRGILSLSLLFILVAAASGFGQEQQGPKIAVPELRHDLGKVKQGRQVFYVFRVTNAGGGILVIERVQAA